MPGRIEFPRLPAAMLAAVLWPLERPDYCCCCLRRRTHGRRLALDASPVRCRCGIACLWHGRDRDARARAADRSARGMEFRRLDARWEGLVWDLESSRRGRTARARATRQNRRLSCGDGFDHTRVLDLVSLQEQNSHSE